MVGSILEKVVQKRLQNHYESYFKTLKTTKTLQKFPHKANQFGVAFDPLAALQEKLGPQRLWPSALQEVSVELRVILHEAPTAGPKRKGRKATKEGDERRRRKVFFFCFKCFGLGCLFMIIFVIVYNMLFWRFLLVLLVLDVWGRVAFGKKHTFEVTSGKRVILCWRDPFLIWLWVKTSGTLLGIENHTCCSLLKRL